jgi:selenocysteine-specific elongation factor
MRQAHLSALGGHESEGIREIDGWLLDDAAWHRWTSQAAAEVKAWAGRDALDPAMPVAALRRLLRVPTDGIAAALAASAGLPVRDGRIHPKEPLSLGPAEDAVRRLEKRLRADPFAAPLADELTELGLGRRELAAAERNGRVLRLTDQIVLAPSAPAEAVIRLTNLPQPFTASQARIALDASRRVTIPLLELLDNQGVTERLEGGLRRLRLG